MSAKIGDTNELPIHGEQHDPMNDPAPVGDSAAPTPSAEQVRAELKRMLESAAFQQAGRASKFLRFVVEETLAGRGDRLKGYTIALEVFDRPSDFDAQSDPLVRVEAGRLRRRLMEYYLSEGLYSPIRIELPRGRYAPIFRYAPEAWPRAEVKSEQSADSRAGRGLAQVVIGVAAVGVLVALAWLLLHMPVTDAPGTGGVDRPPVVSEVRLLVLSLADLSEPPVRAFAAGLTEEAIRAFVDLDIIAVASGTSAALTSASLAELRAQFNAGYVLTGSVRPLGNGVRIGVRLLESSTGTQLWTHTFDRELENRSATEIQEDVAQQIAAMLASPYGPIYLHEMGRLAGRPTESLSPFECLVQFYGYVQAYDPLAHADSLACLQRTVRERPDYAPAWGALGVLYLHEHTFGFDPQPDAGPALARALEAARRSLDIDGKGRVAGAVLLGARQAAGDQTGFARGVERALAMRPEHPAVLAQVGFMLTLNGDWEAGIPLLDRSLPLSPNPPGWLRAAYAFRDLQTRRYEEALTAALSIDAPNWFVAPLTVSAAAALAGRMDLAEREAARLLELFPDFETMGATQLDKWGMDPALAATILDGLRRAGLSIR